MADCAGRRGDPHFSRFVARSRKSCVSSDDDFRSDAGAVAGTKAAVRGRMMRHESGPKPTAQPSNPNER
jgi:hypothetical protein